MSTAAVDQYSYKLKDSWILDTGSDGHLCNDKSRMFDLRPSQSTLFCRAGNTFIDIEGWGSVTLMTKCKGYPNGRPLTLTNVALIPSFHCSLVLFKLLRTKGKMHWNN